MANADVPFGFRPWGKTLRQNYYAVPTAPTIHICIGDLVWEDVTNVVSAKLGLGVAVYDAAVPTTTIGDALLCLGAVTACFDEKMDPIQYIDVARAGDATVAGYVLVADHPYQQFLAQADAAITSTNFELNFEVTSVALCQPDTRTFISTMEINVSGADVTSTIPIRLVRQAFIEDSYAAAGCRYVCQINPLCHRYGAGTTI
jgi:hypothetical protein